MGQSYGLWIKLVLLLSVVFLVACREPAETAIPRLIEQLKSEDARQRNLAARSFADYGKEAKAAVGPLNQALWDDNMGVRSSAAYSLRKIGTPKAKRALESYKLEKERTAG